MGKLSFSGTVLVVSNEPGVAETIAVTLEREGYQAVTAAHGLSDHVVFFMAQHLAPDIILLDVGAAGVDVAILRRYLRDNAGTAHTPIIAMVDPVDAHCPEYLLPSDDRLVKPFTAADLRAVIGAWLEGPRVLRRA